MPRYTYECEGCNAVTTEKRPVDDRGIPACCIRCGRLMHKVFQAGFQIITCRVVDEPENKYVGGFSETERKEARLADDRVYEANWAGAETGFRRTTPAEALAKTPLGALLSQA